MIPLKEMISHESAFKIRLTNSMHSSEFIICFCKSFYSYKVTINCESSFKIRLTNSMQLTEFVIVFVHLFILKEIQATLN